MIIFVSFFLQNNIISLTLLTNIVHRGSALHLCRRIPHPDGAGATAGWKALGTRSAGDLGFSVFRLSVLGHFGYAAGAYAGSCHHRCHQANRELKTKNYGENLSITASF